MSSSAPVLCRTPPRSVPLPQIPEALRALWRTCSAESAESDVSRALAINFVGIAAASGEATLRQAVERLQQRTPCRAFLLVVDPTAPKITAEVAATTRAHGSLLDIVLEEITIRLPEAGFEQIPGLVRPMLVNDLPNHLFWGAVWPRAERHFDELSSLCDHVVTDSRLFLDPARELAHLAARRAGGKRLTDLTWLRLRPWRRALAEGFERLPWQPGTPTMATIRFGTPATSAALLLGSWLEHRLAAAVTLDGSGTATSLCPDLVELRVGDCEIQLVTTGSHVTAHVTTEAHCYLPFKVPVSRGQDGDLLAAAIDHG